LRPLQRITFITGRRHTPHVRASVGWPCGAQPSQSVFTAFLQLPWQSQTNKIAARQTVSAGVRWRLHLAQDTTPLWMTGRLPEICFASVTLAAPPISSLSRSRARYFACLMISLGVAAPLIMRPRASLPPSLTA